MATSSSASCASAAAVPPGFRYETRYVVLNYLGMLPVNRRLPPGESDRRMKEQIEEELRRLEEEVSDSFPGFDRRQSPVFCPPNPDGSVEDCLAAIGDRVSRELGPHLSPAVETLLAGPLDYERFQSTTLDLARRTQAGWDKVLVPLVLLQALQAEGKPLTTLLQLGLRCLEEDEALFITQQGGWGKVLVLEQEEALAGPVADDSNDIYILSEEQLSPPSSLLGAVDSGDPSSWQTESLAASLASHESWAQVAAMEDAKSLEGGEGAALAEERSENNSSNSDIVHVEREEAELLEEGGAIDESTMSVLGTESDLAALRAEFGDPTPAGPLAAPPPMPVAVETSSEPEPLPPVPVPAAEPDPQPEPADPVLVEAAPTPPAEEIVTTTAEPEAPPEPEPEPKPEAEPAELLPLQPEPEPEPEVPPGVSPVLEAPAGPEPAEEFPVLLYGGAVLVLLAAVGAVVLLRRRR